MKKTLYDCPIEATLDVVGGKWKLRILWLLRDEKKRFNELRRGIEGITEKMLIQQLRELESENLIKRVAYPVVPPKVEYSLTSYGETLIPIMYSLNSWGDAHINLPETLKYF